MDFRYTPEEEAFRDEVRAFLDENLPPASERDLSFLGVWSKKVREKRWVGFSESVKVPALFVSLRPLVAE